MNFIFSLNSRLLFPIIIKYLSTQSFIFILTALAVASKMKKSELPSITSVFVFYTMSAFGKSHDGYLYTYTPIESHDSNRNEMKKTEEKIEKTQKFVRYSFCDLNDIKMVSIYVLNKNESYYG